MRILTYMIRSMEVTIMNIEKNFSENTCILAIEGDIDTITAPELDKAVEECAPQCTKLVLDLAGTEYISSAGIRAILKARKTVGGENLFLRNLNNNIMEIIRITGFASSLNIE